MSWHRVILRMQLSKSTRWQLSFEAQSHHHQTRWIHHRWMSQLFLSPFTKAKCCALPIIFVARDTTGRRRHHHHLQRWALPIVSSLSHRKHGRPLWSSSDIFDRWSCFSSSNLTFGLDHGYSLIQSEKPRII